jgi:hypothetical protein
MARTACHVCVVSTVSGCRKNTLGRASASSGHIIILEHNLLFIDIYDSMGRTVYIGVCSTPKCPQQ